MALLRGGIGRSAVRATGAIRAPRAPSGGLKNGPKFSPGIETSFRVGGKEGGGFGGPSIKPTISIDKSRIPGASAPRAEIIKSVHTIRTGAAELGPRTDSSPGLNKARFRAPTSFSENVFGSRSNVSPGEFVNLARRDAVPPRTPRAIPATRPFPIREPGRQNVENGGRSGAISPGVRGLLRQSNFDGRVAPVKPTGADTVQIRPDIVRSAPVSPIRVAPEIGRQAQTIDAQKAVRQARRERPGRSEASINANVIVVDFVRRRRVETGSESARKAPSSQELANALTQTKPDVQIAPVIEIAKARAKARAERRISTELAEIDKNIVARTQPSAKIVPLHLPDVSRSAIVDAPVVEDLPGPHVRRDSIRRSANDAGAYLDALDQLRRQREEQGDEETKKKKKFRIRLLERVKVLQQRLLKPELDPELAPVRQLQPKLDAKAALALNRQAHAQILPATDTEPKLKLVPSTKTKPDEKAKQDLDILPGSKKEDSPGNNNKRDDLIYSVDKQAQNARASTILHAVQSLADKAKRVSGYAVAAALGKVRKPELISAILKSLGITGSGVKGGGSSDVDGSLTKVQESLANSRSENGQDILHDAAIAMEIYPAVKVGKQAESRKVDKWQVDVVLNRGSVDLAA